MLYKRHIQPRRGALALPIRGESNDFVLEKDIFSGLFNKDIKRVFIYKKAERLAKAIYLIVPAFQDIPVLRDRLSAIAVGLIDAAILSPIGNRTLSRELLTLSSTLSVASTSGMLSVMNAELISEEARTLLQEIAVYEEPRVPLEDIPSFSELSRLAQSTSERGHKTISSRATAATALNKSALRQGRTQPQRQIKDSIKDSRRAAILSVIRTKKKAQIKDI